MKESPAKVKKNRASARQLSRVILLAMLLELLRPAVHPPSGVPRDRPSVVPRTTLALGTPQIAPRPVTLIEPLLAAAPKLALL